MERDGVHIVCLGVEMDEGEAFLQHGQKKGQRIANNEAPQNDESSKIQENMTKRTIGGAQSFHHANEIGALQNNYQQPAQHREARDANHENQNDQDIHIEEVKPIEDNGV